MRSEVMINTDECMDEAEFVQKLIAQVRAERGIPQDDLVASIKPMQTFDPQGTNRYDVTLESGLELTVTVKRILFKH